MIQSRLRYLLAAAGTSVVLAQNPNIKLASNQTPVTAAARPAAQTRLTLQKIYDMLQAGVDEATVITQVERARVTFPLTPDDLIALRKLGATNQLIGLLNGTPRSAGGAQPAPQPAAPVMFQRASLPQIARAAKKKRITVQDFEYSAAVRGRIQSLVGSENLGHAIAAMMVRHTAQNPSLTLLERRNLEASLKEQEAGVTNRIRKGTESRIGKIQGAEAFLLGEVIVFNQETKVQSLGVGRALCRFRPELCRFTDGVSAGTREDKAIVVLGYRLIDSESSVVLHIGEARGVVVHKNREWRASTGSGSGASGGSASANFEQTIMGEAMMAAVKDLADQLTAYAPKLAEKDLDVESRVAAIDADRMTIAGGSIAGLVVGDRLIVEQIVGEIKDPVTGEVLDLKTKPAGEMILEGVRDKISYGPYSGSFQAAGKYVARLAQNTVASAR